MTQSENAHFDSKLDASEVQSQKDHIINKSVLEKNPNTILQK